MTTQPPKMPDMVVTLSFCNRIGNNDSVLRRIRNAQNAGKENLEIYRPRGSILAETHTETLIEFFKHLGFTVTPELSSSPSIRKLTVGNLGVYKL